MIPYKFHNADDLSLVNLSIEKEPEESSVIESADDETNVVEDSVSASLSGETKEEK